MVARVTLNNMRQDRDEPVRAFAARLRGQAGVCKFTHPCTGCGGETNYTDAIIRDVLCRGIGQPRDDPGTRASVRGSKGGRQEVRLTTTPTPLSRQRSQQLLQAAEETSPQEPTAEGRALLLLWHPRPRKKRPHKGQENGVPSI